MLAWQAIWALVLVGFSPIHPRTVLGGGTSARRYKIAWAPSSFFIALQSILRENCESLRLCQEQIIFVYVASDTPAP